MGNCWESAGRQFSVEPKLLYAIAEVESGLNTNAINHNKDGTRDVGVMQINSIHLPRLSAKGITERHLIEEPCVTINVGAQILAEFVARHGYNWTAVGAYNAGSGEGRQAARMQYAHKVWLRYRALQDW
ncbi:Soluble lytic murein transglycosylase and related regulatory proteins (some contain LysM/invasin domains) [Pseudomonas sp. LAMO17WK12:I10]|nr:MULTISPECIES: transglycosylase SLT domain-containing protein [unclassified Pseudomonas]PXX53998.1 transglycosylase-like protein with SLT domain [Pseudomonas sp. LAMO17WK12:I9]SNY51926.1 Soluble lytic murein transglycosylase and related regulatory proteins (some contain LysM/invasin domains) [Pseudomonas sp. LAMO17WK12:I10]